MAAYEIGRAADAVRQAGRGKGSIAIGGVMSDTGQEQRPGAVPLTVASFFSGGGGGTLGLTRAGWHPVSFSEIEPFPIAILETHWPDTPNLGDITSTRTDDIPEATLWMGGFPCQDLSLAGPRRGLRNDDGSLTRSGLAFTFLALAEARRPPAILLENVAGLRSSNQGRDLTALLDQVGDIGYSIAFRQLDSQYAGVPQRRKRVFLLAFDLERYPDEYLPGEVLGISSSCTRDHQQEREAWQAFARSAVPGPGVRRPAGGRLDVGGAPADANGGGAANGVPGWLDGPKGLDPRAFSKVSRVRSATTAETWADTGIANTQNTFDVGDIRTTTIVLDARPPTDGPEDPKGLDSKRFQVIGNGVVTSMTEWIGRRLAKALLGATPTEG